MTIPKTPTLLAIALILTWMIGVAVNAQDAPAKGGNPVAKKLKNPVASTPESIAKGAATYKKYCAYCHNEDGTGDGALAPKDSHPPSLVDAEWTYGSSDGEIFTLTQEGAGPKSVMKGFSKKITEQDAWNVVNFVRSLQKTGNGK